MDTLQSQMLFGVEFRLCACFLLRFAYLLLYFQLFALHWNRFKIVTDSMRRSLKHLPAPLVELEQHYCMHWESRAVSLVLEASKLAMRLFPRSFELTSGWKVSSSCSLFRQWGISCSQIATEIEKTSDQKGRSLWHCILDRAVFKGCQDVSHHQSN